MMFFGAEIFLCFLYDFNSFFKFSLIFINQLKRVKFTNCSQFLSHNYFGLDFHFHVIFLLIGIGQLDNDV